MAPGSSYTRSHWCCKRQILSECQRSSKQVWGSGCKHQALSPGQLCGGKNTKIDRCFLKNVCSNISPYNNCLYHVRDSVSIFLGHPPAVWTRKALHRALHPGRRLWCWWWWGRQTNTHPQKSNWAEARCRSGLSHGCSGWPCLSKVGYLSKIDCI